MLLKYFTNTSQIKIILLLAFFILTKPSFVFTQVPKESLVQEILEELYEETGNSIKYEEIEYFIANPKPMEKFTPNELSAFLGTPKNLSNSLKKAYKKIKILETLCDSFQLLPSQCALLKLIIIQEETETKPSIDSMHSIKLRSRFYYTSDKTDINTLGNPIDSYQRVIFSSYLFDLGICISKDPGEPSYLETYKFFAKKELGNSTVILGNFTVENSNGLILWSPYSTSKTPLAIFGIVNNVLRIQPTLTTANYATFRGVAGKINLQLSKETNLSISSFVSKTPRSGTLDSTGKIVTSFYLSELFIKTSNITKKNNIDEFAGYVSLQINSNNFSLSYSPLFLKYDKQINTKSKKYILGNSATLHSFSSKFNIMKNLDIISEVAFSRVRDISTNSSILFRKNKISALFSFRYFSPNFRSPFGLNYGETSSPNNELGILFASEFKVHPFTFQLLFDNFKSIQPTSNLQVPMFGKDYYLQAFFPIYNSRGRIRLQRKEKTDYVLNISNTKQIPYQKINYRFLLEILYPFGNAMNINSRFDYSIINNQGFKKNETGINLLCGLEYQIIKGWNIGTQLDYFSTNSFETAIYVFEYLAPGLMQSVAYYDNGIKCIFWTNFKLFENRLKIFIRYFYDKRKTLKHFILTQCEFTFDF